MAVFSNDEFEVPAGHHVFIIEATSSLMIQEARASGGRSSGHVERWCTARNIQDARRQARAWADDIGEGIMIDDVRSDEAIILPSQTVGPWDKRCPPGKKADVKGVCRRKKGVR